MRAPPPRLWERHPMRFPVTICALFYGNYPHLARRLLSSLEQHTPSESCRLRIGLNAVCEETLDIVSDYSRRIPIEILIHSGKNLFKIPMMRRLFHERPLSTDWTLWFDDDSYVTQPDWLPTLAMETRARPEVDLWGTERVIRTTSAIEDFVRASDWYAGREFIEDEHPGRHRIRFVASGYWAIRTACIQVLDWPDPRLTQFGDDYMLGEAMRQIGAKIGGAQTGVVVNGEQRRAPPDTPSSDALH